MSIKPVYGALALALGLAATASAQPRLPPLAGAAAQTVLDARDALRTKDAAQLAALSARAQADRHPLASWIDYWEIGLRLKTLTQAEADAFYARWPGTYVEDRFRNDWLLELGKRRDWANVARDFPRFRMNDDREVTCYALLARHAAQQAVRDDARAAWLAQRDPDDGCHLMASTLVSDGVFQARDIHAKLRSAAEAGRWRSAQRAAVLLPAPAATAALAALSEPARALARAGDAPLSAERGLWAALALARLAANDPAEAAQALRGRWAAQLPPELAGWAWAQAARQAAMGLRTDAAEWFEQAGRHAPRGTLPDWSDDTLAWAARAGLRADRPAIVLGAIDAMSGAERQQPTWRYWAAYTRLRTAGDDATREGARAQLRQIASPLSFYGRLAAEALQEATALPPAPAPLSPAELHSARQHPGLQRALALIELGLRNEGVREWNYSLRGLGERELLAAAQLACAHEVWDRCISTSERTRGEIDLRQRYPMPLQQAVVAQARAVGLDPAYVYGLIRQESRFVMDARSSVGASGLMQVMPATAQWTARRAGIPYRPEMLTDRDTNLRLGTTYLKLVLDDMNGSLPLAAAAYNAGPNRPRRWREGPLLDATIWVENVPFTETRDYVKNVIANTTVYAELLGARTPLLSERLGTTIGPRSGAVAGQERERP